MSTKKRARLEEWRLMFEGDVLVGRVYGHPEIPDGEIVTTSRVAYLEGNLAITKNTEYELGKHADDC